MKRYFSLFSLFAVLLCLHQRKVMKALITYDKKKQRAIMIDYTYSAEAVQNAIVKKMERMGYKPKEEKGIFNKDKGFLVFKNACGHGYQ